MCLIEGDYFAFDRKKMVAHYDFIYHDAMEEGSNKIGIGSNSWQEVRGGFKFR